MQYVNDVEAIKAFNLKIVELKNEISKIIVGQDKVVEQILISIFSKGHCLLIGVPGLAKTLIINTIAKTLGLSFNRIQFTPDLMPSDIVGAEILDENRKFKFIKGPVFANIILADEINRTPPKTQSALLEAMQEKEVTAAGTTYSLDEPFFVLATQNPIEQEGTYPLPEAQLDRFMFDIWLEYPSFDEEINIVKATTTGLYNKVNTIMTKEEIIFFQNLIRKVPVTDNLYKYVVNFVSKTRPVNTNSPSITKEYISWGAGPRASQYLILGAKTNAIINGKYSPDIEDVEAIAKEVLRHRIVINYKAEANGYKADDIVNEIIKSL
ncbi:MAG: AAA family ATPase [Bacteroidetes bacterium GWE2_29_8]|nr:MAG: AAA family ATPase [Bacteroidetes bacterium GWE2_29_8]OFY14405.1 MAG: AAA family ATPase [Bacteroidetes bacterium GWF2_29_10]